MKIYSDSIFRRPMTIVVMACVFLTGGLLGLAAKDREAKAVSREVAVSVDSTPLAREGGTEISLAPIVKRVAPSVVKVVVSHKAKEINTGSMGGMSPFDDPMLRRFFGPGMPGQQERSLQQQPPQTGLGSGVIVSTDGYILTNNHVVDDADEVVVTMDDGREFVASVVGKDDKTDVAVIKVDAAGLPAVTLSDSNDLQVGDRVLAIGNPFGLGQTVTTGIVSGKGRELSMGLDYEDFIQTDAAINPGNSGGALVDMQGRLIGINTAIFSRSGGFQGIGFAIPVDLARSVMNSLVQDGHVTRGYLGIAIQNLTPALSEHFGLGDRDGVLVGDVNKDGPAADSGLEHGDVILKFNSKPTPDARALRFAVAETKPGTEAEVLILRDGDEKTLTLEVGNMPGEKQLADGGSAKENDEGVLNGVGVSDLTREIRREFSIPLEVQGAVVSSVEPDSPATKAGLAPGDVIVEINRQPVENAADAVEMTRDFGDGKTLLRLWSRGASHYLVVDESNRSGQ